jgi:hypothetical protein
VIRIVTHEPKDRFERLFELPATVPGNREMDVKLIFDVARVSLTLALEIAATQWEGPVRS